MSNLAELNNWRYDEAEKLLGTEREGEGINMLEEMSHDRHLSLWLRLQVHHALGRAVDETHIAHEHHIAARAAYNEIMERWPLKEPASPRSRTMHEDLAVLNTRLDELKADLDAEDLENLALAGSDQAMQDIQRPATREQSKEEVSEEQTGTGQRDSTPAHSA